MFGIFNNQLRCRDCGVDLNLLDPADAMPRDGSMLCCRVCGAEVVVVEFDVDRDGTPMAIAPRAAAAPVSQRD